MQLLIVRHGIARDRATFAASGQPDDLRPLTVDGARKMEEVARGLRRMVPAIDLLAASPLVRARQTAEILSSVYEQPVVETDVLRPDAARSSFAPWAKGNAECAVIAIVGHEPHLSGLIAWLIGESGDARIAMKKGGACVLDFERMAAHGAGTLLWLLPPGAIRRIRRR